MKKDAAITEEDYIARRSESNYRLKDFQPSALPHELPGQEAGPTKTLKCS